MTSELIIQALALVGVGGILKGAFDLMYASKKMKQDAHQEFKQKRYKAIVILCHAMSDYPNQGEELKRHRPNIDTKEKLRLELQSELVNMVLYASDDVMNRMSLFIEKSDSGTLLDLGFAMRKDMFGIKTRYKQRKLKEIK